jgi:proline dehydrogenase
MAASVQTKLPTIVFEDTAVAFASKSDPQLRKTYRLFAIMNQRWAVNLGTFFIKLALKLHLPVKNLVRRTIFLQFCGGETVTDCNSTISTLAKSGVKTILDYSVEGENNAGSFDQIVSELLKTIDCASSCTNIPFTVFKVSAIGSSELLEKIQSGAELEAAEVQEFEQIKKRVDLLCRYSSEKNIPIFIDGEESWVQNVIDSLAYEMMARYNRHNVIVYNTYQFYKTETLKELKAAYLKAREKGYRIGCKLVRGAYMEKERVHAQENQYCDPIHKSKESTDKDFNMAIDFCLDHIDVIAMCLGTHNEYSCNHCIQKIDRLGLELNNPNIWFAQLLGMSDNITYNLAKAGYNVAKHVPYGPLEAVAPYLFRRAEENQSLAGQSSREYLLIQKEIKRRNKCTV